MPTARGNNDDWAAHLRVDEDTWLEFVPAGEGYEGYECCGLCGNSGVVDTRGTAKTPLGKDCGVRRFCICPNGRTLKHHQGGFLP